MSRERRTIPLVRDLVAATSNCPLAPGEKASVQSRALHRACLILGGAARLATDLGVSEGDIRAWLTGAREVPHAVFVAAVEIVLLHASGDTQQS